MNKAHSLDADFPAARLYRALHEPAARMVRETATQDGVSFSERHLQCVWYDAAWRPAALATSRGEEVVVESPGRWNLEAGPDFIGAALRIGPDRRRLCGDVEIHVRPMDWREHGHGGGYAGVIAHVSYFPGELPPGTLPAGAVQISLRDALKTVPSFSFDSIDTTAYPFATFPSEDSPCARVLGAWTHEQRMAFLDSAGEERLRRKAERAEADVQRNGADQALYEGIMSALGYKHNRAAFARMARVVTQQTLRDEADGDALSAYALLLGVAGLIPAKAPPGADEDTRRFIRQLWNRWWKCQSRWAGCLMSREDWKLSSLRPQNHPVRRLAAAACLFSARESLAERLAAIDASRPDAWFAGVARLFEDDAGVAYWKHRLGFSGTRRPQAVSLLGTGRIAAIQSNVIVPFLAATGRDVAALLPFLPAEEDNALLRQTAHALFGRDHNPALYHEGLKQQGLLQVFHDFCLVSRSGCAECRLPPALSSATTSFAR